MSKQPVSLSTPIYLGVFNRAEQRSCKRSSRQLREVTANALLSWQCSLATRIQASQPRATRSPKRSKSAFSKDRAPLCLLHFASQHSYLRSNIKRGAVMIGKNRIMIYGPNPLTIPDAGNCERKHGDSHSGQKTGVFVAPETSRYTFRR